MHVRFAKADKTFIEAQVKDGFYASETELVRDAVRRLREDNDKRLRDLRSLIDEADADVAAGRTVSFQSADQLTASIVKQGRKQ